MAIRDPTGSKKCDLPGYIKIECRTYFSFLVAIFHWELQGSYFSTTSLLTASELGNTYSGTVMWESKQAKQEPYNDMQQSYSRKMYYLNEYRSLVPVSYETTSSINFSDSLTFDLPLPLPLPLLRRDSFQLGVIHESCCEPV